MFVDLIFPEVPKGSRVAIYCRRKGPGPTKHCQTSEKAERYALENSSKGYDTYLAMGLQPEGLSNNQRAGNDQVAGIPGLWADVDFSVKGSRKRYFPSKTVAMSFVRSLPVSPSLIVYTGGGLHIYWLFEEIWTFEDDPERESAIAISKGWGRFLQAQAKRVGHEIDSTWDLARILRVAGTKNFKYRPPRNVEIFEQAEGHRLNPSDFEPWLPVGPEVEPADVDPIVVEPDDPKVPLVALQRLFDLDPRVRPTWEKRRADLSDQSMSAYEMALANFAATAEWNHQQIADLLVAFRKVHGLKAKHARYYELTIGKALATHIAVITAEEELADPTPPQLSGDEGDDRKADLAAFIRSKTNLPIARILQFGGSEDPQYCLVLEGDHLPVLIGGVSAFCSRRKWREADARAHLGLFTPPKPAVWTNVLQAATRIVEEITTPELEPGAVMRQWLSRIARDAHQVRDKAQLYDVVNQGIPFLWNDHLHFQFEYLYTDLLTHRERITRGDLQRRLAVVEAESHVVSVRARGSRLQRRFLRVPEAELEVSEAYLEPVGNEAEEASEESG